MQAALQTYHGRFAFAPSRTSGNSSARQPGARLVVCMAHPRRVVKVAKQIEREVGNLLVHDRVVQQAVCPERKRGLDSAVSAVASVTEVQLSRDMQVAKVFLSVYSDDAGREQAMAALKDLQPYVRSAVARAVRLRLMPEIRFVADDSIERTERVFKLLEQVKRIEAGEAEPPPLAFYTDDEDEEEEGEEGGDDLRLEQYGGIVDMGLFEDDAPSSSRPARGAPPRARRPAAPPVRQRAPAAQDEALGGELSPNEVADMVAYFRQESAGRGKGGAGGRRG